MIEKAIIYVSPNRCAAERLTGALSGLSDIGIGQILVAWGASEPDCDGLKETAGRFAGQLQIQFHCRPDCLAAAEAFADGQQVFCIDLAYPFPRSALLMMRVLKRPALALIRRNRLGGGFSAGAVPQLDNQGFVARLRPAGERLDSPFDYVHINCWLFDQSIYRAFRAVGATDLSHTDLAAQHSIDVLRVAYKAIHTDW